MLVVTRAILEHGTCGGCRSVYLLLTDSGQWKVVPEWPRPSWGLVGAYRMVSGEEWQRTFAQRTSTAARRQDTTA